MMDCVVLPCPLCGRGRLYDPEEASTDRLREGIMAHIVEDHPETMPPTAEEAIGHAIERATPVSVDDPTFGSWTRGDWP